MRGRVVVAWLVAFGCVALVGWATWISGLPGADVPDFRPVVAGFVLAWSVTGAVLVTLRPANVVGWLLLGIGTLQALSAWGNMYGAYGVGVAHPQWFAADWVAQATSMLYFPSLVLPGTVLLALYPSGHLPARWWRWPVAAVATGITVLTLGASLTQGTYDDIAPGPAPVDLPSSWAFTLVGGLGFVFLFAGTVTIWVATGFRLAHARSPERQQLAWLVVAVVGLFLAVFVHGGSFLWVFAFLLPVAVVVGIVRYGLLGVVLSRGLTYALLTLVVLAVYVAVTALAGSALDHGPVPGIAAAALVAVGLAPARERVQRGVDRFVYGERKDPIQAVTALGSRMETSDEGGLLDAVVAGVAEAVRAPGVSVVDPTGRALATWGDIVPADAESLPLYVSGRPVGALVVAPQVAGSRDPSADRRVLAALAPLVAVVVHALDLADALEAERDRVVTATRSERDRLRSELHDGLGPSLSGTALGLQAASDALAGGRTDAALHLLDRMQTEAAVAVAEVRRIIDDLRPAGLDEGGLDLAIRRRAAAVSPALDVDVRIDDLPVLAPDVEAAAYRITGEALSNAVRHAHAQHASVELGTSEGALTVRVADDGCGIVDDASVGVGLASMRRRAESLGGSFGLDSNAQGTVVTARLPLTQPA